MISLASLAGRVSLENSTAPPVPALPEADASDMDYFVSQLQIVLPVLGVNAIRVPTVPVRPAAAEPNDSPVFHLRQAKLGVEAHAQQIDGEFTMLAGSVVVPSWHGVGKAESTIKAYESYRNQHRQLVDNGAITVADGVGRLTRNVVFSSPSTAGAMALGAVLQRPAGMGVRARRFRRLGESRVGLSGRLFLSPHPTGFQRSAESWPKIASSSARKAARSTGGVSCDPWANSARDTNRCCWRGGSPRRLLSG